MLIPTRLWLLLTIWLFISTTALAAPLPPPADRKVDFVKEVQPILTTACVRCHGPDLQEGKYRVDVREIALTQGESFAPSIVPGKSAESPLIQLVAGEIDGMFMPAKGAPLTKEQIGILRAWIDQGADWPASASAKVEDKLAWWSLRPLAAVPAPQRADVDNPVDAFILTKLAEHKLSPAPLADRRTLLRRLTFDLHGLPPTLEELAAFEHDARPDAYERVVDRLLASPRYGERWARHWMDTAHFAETHGHDQDRIREHAWPYRDYLIAAFNSDKPYDRFVAEQVAGDALFPDSPEATVALGFLAAGPWDESTLRDIREDTLDRQIGRYVDRDDIIANVMNNFVGLTVQCARCHDHKFDPISQADYYALQAVFSGIERASRTYDRDPTVQQQRRLLAAQERELASPTPELLAKLSEDSAQAVVARWEASLAARPAIWKSVAPLSVQSAEGATLSVQKDDSVLSSGARPERDTYNITLRSPLKRITALRLEVLTDNTLPHQGPGRQDNGNLHLSEIEVFAGAAGGTPVAIASAVADFDQDGWGVARAIDSNPQTAWGIYPQVGKPHEAIFEFKEPLTMAADANLVVVLKQLHGGGHLIGRPRLSLTDAPTPVTLHSLPREITEMLAIEAKQRNAEQRTALALFQQRQHVAAEIAKLPAPSLVYAAASDFAPDGGLKPPPGPRPIHLLNRGDIRQPREEAKPGTVSCITSLASRFEVPAGAPEAARRAALAKWLVDRQNPLTWRSIVNRTWQQHFGRGLAEMPNDLGRIGATPSHPELLDYLAARFRDEGQSLKSLHRLLVTSRTYRQSASAAQTNENNVIVKRTDAAQSIDADNRLLWRMTRTRLDAECVRDAVLAMTERLEHRMGGPSDRQFDMKPGRHVTPIIDYAPFDLDSAAGQRRSVYRFLFRTLPDPFMEALDCPAGDQFTPTRTNSVTVQQALAMWNDAFLLRHCEHFAARLERGAPTTAERVELAFELALARRPTAAEQTRFTTFAEQHGLANFCRVLLNLNEFLYLN